MTDTTPLAAASVADLAEILTQLNEISPPHLVAIRHGEPLQALHSANHRAASEWALKWNSRGYGIYWSPSNISPGVTTKPAKSDVHSTRSIWVDVDLEDRTGARDSARPIILAKLGVGIPSLVIDSGNGYQAVWNLDQAWPAHTIEAANKALIEHYDGDSSCFNVDRVLRLPGTINYPSPSKRARGYTEQPAKLVRSYPAPRGLGVAMRDAGISDAAAEAVFDTKERPENTEPRPATEDQALLWAGQCERVMSMLEVLDSDDRDTWLRVGQILEYEFGYDALECWCRWADSSDKYDPDAQSKTWDGFERRQSGAVLRLGSLVQMAREAGWEFEPPEDFQAAVSVFEPQPIEPAEPPPPVVRRFKTRDQRRADAIEETWLLDGFLPGNALCELFGEPGHGKSTVAVDMVLHVAAGLDWKGFDYMSNGGRVFYLAGEDAAGISKRIDGWESKHGATPEVHVSGTPARITEAADVALWVAEFDAWATEGHTPELLVIDTLAANFGDGDENSTADMLRFIAAVNGIRERYKCCVMVIHHTVKADRNGKTPNASRGSGAWRGALDMSAKVEQDDGRVVVTVTKLKNDEKPRPVYGEIERVELGQNSRGKMISAGVFTTAAASVFSAGAKPETEKIARVIVEAVRDAGPEGLALGEKAAAAVVSERLEGVSVTREQAQTIIAALTGDGVLAANGARNYIRYSLTDKGLGWLLGC